MMEKHEKQDRHLSDARLDAAIDRAVREMMSAEPRADLRQRVMAALAGPPERAALWPRLAWASAVLAVLVVFALTSVRRPAERAADEARAPAPAMTVPERPADVTPQPPDPRPGDRVAARAGGRPAGPIVRRPTAPPLTDRPVQAASISPAEAFESETIDAGGRLAALAPITIRPITVAPIAVTPLASQR